MAAAAAMLRDGDPSNTTLTAGDDEDTLLLHEPSGAKPLADLTSPSEAPPPCLDNNDPGKQARPPDLLSARP